MFKERIIHGRQTFLNRKHSALISRLFADNFHAHKKRYFCAGIFMILAALATGGTAYVVKDIVNAVFIADNFQQALVMGLATSGLFFIKGFATYMHSVIMARTGNAIVATARMRVFTHLIELPLRYFDRVTIGEVFVRANAGVEAVHSILNMLIISLGRDLVTLLALIVVMFIQEPFISTISLVIGPLTVFLIGKAARKTKKLARAQLQTLSEKFWILKETVTGILMIKTFSLEEEMAQRIKKIAHEIQQQNDKMAGLQARTSPIMETLGGLVIGAIIIYAGWRSVSNLEHLGGMMSFLTAFLLAYDPAKRLARLRVSIEPLLVSAQHMYELLDHEKPETGEQHTNQPIIKGHVSFENVTFSYRDGEPTLCKINLVAEPNQRIAIIGPSGCGKSTLFKLMLGLYPLDEGAIYFDAVKAEELSLSTRRHAMAYVGQDAYVFSGTIYDNIRFGRLNASRKEIEDAALAAHAYDFITKLPDGFQTFIGENGALLSGGQRQRIVIARAFLKNAPILLLDEATSALDAESEKEIETALEELGKGKTTFLIGHRLSTLQHSDKIYVMQAGEIVEEGKHATLLAKNGVYSNLYRLYQG